MRFFETGTSPGEGTVGKALPQGLNSPAELVDAYKKALVRQQEASEAWRVLMEKHIEFDSPYSLVLQCAEASGMPYEELRGRLAAPPSTLSRWFNGLAQPARMLRGRLNTELLDGVKSWIARIAAERERLNRVDPRA